MKFFKEITTKTKDPSKQNMVIMGRKTWDSLPEQFRPLPDRVNLVLTRNADSKFEGALQASSLQEAVELAGAKIEKIFIIGGGSIYQQALEQLDLAGVYITQVDLAADCDTYFPEVAEKFPHETSLGEMEEAGIAYEFFLYERE